MNATQITNFDFSGFDAFGKTLRAVAQTNKFAAKRLADAATPKQLGEIAALCRLSGVKINQESNRRYGCDARFLSKKVAKRFIAQLAR